MRAKAFKQSFMPVRFRPRHLVLASVALALVWLVVSTMGAAFLSSRRPAVALRLNASEPNALIAIAQLRLDSALARHRELALAAAEQARAGNAAALKGAPAAPSPSTPSASASTPSASSPASDRQGVDGKRENPADPVPAEPLIDANDVELIARQAARALDAAPLDARALRLLAQLADVAGDVMRKRDLLRAAIVRTKHEPLVGYWLMLEAIERKDFKEAVHYADVVLSKNPELAQYVTPALASILDDKQGAEALKTLLRSNPGWRTNFFLTLPSSITDVRTPLELMLTLKGTPAPPTHQEIRGYLNFLFGRQLVEVAYYAWLQTLDAEALKRVARVNNGSFESVLTDMPFDWKIPRSAGATVDIRRVPGEAQRALYFEFEQGRVEFQPVQQYIVLQPGTYTLSMKQKGDVTGRRGMQWSVLCGTNYKRLGETPMMLGKVPEWQQLKVDFSVPEENCRYQIVQLTLAARMASEQLVTGSGWYDELEIVSRVAPE